MNRERPEVQDAGRTTRRAKPDSSRVRFAGPTVAVIGDLQQCVGNRAVSRLVQRDVDVSGFRVTPPDEAAKLRALGIRLPTVRKGPATDVRGDPAYVDNRVDAVAYGIARGGYLLCCEGAHPLLVPEGLVNFGSLGPASSVNDTISSDYQTAMETVPYGPHPRGVAMPYAYYRAPGAGGVILPTLFTPATAPATVALMKDAVLELVADVREQLTIAAIQVIGAGIARILIAAAGPLGVRLGQGKVRAPGRASPKASDSAPQPKPNVVVPKTELQEPVFVPKHLDVPAGERLVISPVRQTVYHAPGGNDPPPNVVMSRGLPARGANTNLWDHVNEIPGSAFRGTTQTPGQAAQWGSDVVYKLRRVETYEVNSALVRIDKGVAGFSGNPMRGENEFAIRAAVPLTQIEGYYPIVNGRLGQFVPNPNLAK